MILTVFLLLCGCVLARHESSSLSIPNQAPKQGFILAVTSEPVQKLKKTSELGIMLSRLCDDLEANFVIVVGSENEVGAMRSYLSERSCKSGVVKLEQFLSPGKRELHTAIRGKDKIEFTRALRRFKVAAIKNHWTAAGDHVIYLDTDALPRKGTHDALFAIFDTMSLSVGFTIADNCVPDHHELAGVPFSFCERNGGVIFLRGPGASVIIDDWLTEFEKNPSFDGHDQVSLRSVLYRHQEALYTLPKIYNCHTNYVEGCLIIHYTHYGRVPDRLKETWKPINNSKKKKKSKPKRVKK